MSQLYFREEQKMKHAWIWLVLGVLSGSCFLLEILLIYVADKTPLNPEIKDEGLFIVAILIPMMFFVLFFVFLKSSLQTEVRDKEVHIRFPIFYPKTIRIKADELVRFEIVDYNAMKDFGGHGIKTKKNVKSFTVSGKKGIRFYTNNGKVIFVGTQRANAFASAIEKIKMRN
ncbi:MAG: hypothetical protein JXR34_01520 [Bacteroidales bacterium]|nr:hypothetical protein [Bacteroidales bacterium]